MVSTEDYLGIKDLMPKVLQRKNNCQKFSASRAIIFLRLVKNTGKEGNGPFYTVYDLA